MSKKQKLYPSDTCHKCGKRHWSECAMPFTWGCAYCGNLLYFTYGATRQQIDLVMASPRGHEFARSESGKSIVPIRNQDLLAIDFAKKTGGAK